MQIWALIVDSFRDAIDRKIFWIMAFISLSVTAAMACISFQPGGIDVLFGTWTIELDASMRGAEHVKQLAGTVALRVIAEPYIGWIGIILALIATASTFPSLMQSGAIDLVLSKPITRTRLFVGKYLGAMVFVLLQTTLFVVPTFLVIGLRWHHWMVGYLWLIPLLVIMFSYLFAFCALFAVLTRNAMTSVLLTLLAWIAIWAPQTARDLVVQHADTFDPTGKWQRVFTAATWILPKTQDIPVIAAKFAGASLLTDLLSPGKNSTPNERRDWDDAKRHEQRESERVQPVASVGSSLASEAVVMLVAIWQFRRKDF